MLLLLHISKQQQVIKHDAVHRVMFYLLLGYGLIRARDSWSNFKKEMMNNMLSPSRSSSSIAAGASKQHKKWHLDDDAYSKYIAHSITQYCDWMLPCNMAVCIHWCYVLYSVHSRWWRRVPSTSSSSCIRSKSQNYYIPIGFTILMGKCSFRLFELVAYISWVYNNTISNQ